jgi:hypothetical protein
MSAEKSLAPLDMQFLMGEALKSGPDGAATLERLVALQERMLDRDATAQFSDALNRFQSVCPAIDQDKKAKAGAYSYGYASFEHISREILPFLKECGLSYTFNSALDGNLLTLTCRLRHVGGHCEDTSFTVKVDDSARMNDAQKLGSARSYAKRYALVDALGIRIGELDDDGKTGGGPLVTEAEAANIRALLDELPGTEEKFLAWCEVSEVEQIPQSKYGAAIKALEAKRKQ